MGASPSDVQVSQGSGTNIATYSFVEAAVAKQLQRIAANDGFGNPLALPSQPTIVQKASNVSSGSVATLAEAFGSNNVAGNTIVVVCAVGNGSTPTVSDSNSNTYAQANYVANGSSFGVGIFFAVNVAAGANTVTVTNGGSNDSIAMEIYEVSGLLAIASAQPGANATNSGSSGTAATSALTPGTPNRFIFAGIAVGTAPQTITPGNGFTNDSGQQNPATPAGLYSFVSMSQYLATIGQITPQATFTSEPWAIAAATFRPIPVSIEGSTLITDGLNQANVLAGDSGYNGLMTGQATKTISFSTSVSGAQIIGPYNVEGYGWIEVIYTSIGSGLALAGQFAPNSGGSYVSAATWGIAGSNNSNNSLLTNNATWFYSPIHGNMFQINVSALTSGTFSGYIILHTGACPYAVQTVNQGGGNGANPWTVTSNSATGSGVPANAFYIAGNSSSNLLGINADAMNADGRNAGLDALYTMAVLMGYNGSTLDRQRNNFNTTTGDTPTLTTTAASNGATQTNYNAAGAVITAILGTVSGSAITLTMQLQWSPDGGTTWLNYGAATSAVSVATGNTVTVLIAPGIDNTMTLGSTGSKVLQGRLPRTWRMVYTAGGSSISIAISSVQVNYLME